MCRVMHHNRDLFNRGVAGEGEEMFTIPESEGPVVAVCVCVHTVIYLI